MAQLVISPLAYPGSGPPLDLSRFMDVDEQDGMDPANPPFTQRVWSHSLLKPGGVQALEDFQVKELLFPLRLNPNNYAVAVMKDGPVSYWRFDEPSGTNAEDQQDFADGTYTGTVTLGEPGALPQDPDTAALFDGSTAFVTVPGSRQLNPPVFTYEIWANPTSLAGSHQTLFNPFASNKGVQFFTNGTTLEASLYDGATGHTFTNTSAIPSTGQWYHIVLTYDGATATMYVNGVALANTLSLSTFVNATSATALLIGSASGSSYWAGYLDEPAVYNYPLTATQVATHYQMGPSPLQRDGVSFLLQNMNAMLNAPGQTIAWQDQGANNPTFFDVAAGQFDIEYNYRAAGNYWLFGKLRVFTQPLGHTGTSRLVASAAGTGPLLVMPIPSPILGDAGALIQAQVGGGVATEYHRAAVSVLPYGYRPLWPPASLTMLLASLTGGSGAVASRFGRWAITVNTALANQETVNAVITPNIIPYFGMNRLFAVARTSAPSTVSFIGQWDNTNTNAVSQLTTGPTGFSVGTDWQLIDLGAFLVPSSFAAATNTGISIDIGVNAASSAATRTADVTGLIVLPDGQTTYIDELAANVANVGGTVTFDMFDGVGGETWWGAGGWAAPTGVLRTTPFARGAVPKLQPALAGGSQQIAVVLMGATAIIAGHGQPANDTISGAVYARERFRFDRG